MLDIEKKVIVFLKSQRHPFTMNQISSRLTVPEAEVCKTLCRLQALGMIRIEYISPGCGMVMARPRLFHLSDEGIDELCHDLYTEKTPKMMV